jgi:hypothetical protein
MSRILTGICRADPANRLYEVAVSRGISFVNAKERFRVQISFKNAMTQPSEDRFLAELLTVHHFLSDPSILWHMEKQVYASTTLWASTSAWLPDISAQSQYARRGKDHPVYACSVPGTQHIGGNQ